MFRVWTRLPLGRKTKNRKNRFINVCQGTTANLATELSYYEDVEPVLNSPNQLYPILNKTAEEFPQLEMGVGIIDNKNLETLDLTRIGNGVVFILNLEAIKNYRTSGVSLKVDDRLRLVTAMPLSFYAWIMRCPIAPPLRSGPFAYDFRLFYFYGKLPGWLDRDQELAQRILCQVEIKQNELRKSEGHDLWQVPANPRFHMIYGEQEIVYGPYCLTCERKVEWSVGLCAFGKYNCVLGTDLRPELLSAPLPDFERFFGTDEFVDKEECVDRADFTPWLTTHLREEGDADFAVRRKRRAKRSTERGARVRMRNALCRICRAGDEKVFCQRDIESCAGPYFDEDISPYLKPVEPWQLHVLALSRTKLEIEDIRRLFPKLSPLSKIPLQVVRPITERQLREHTEEWENLQWSPNSKLYTGPHELQDAALSRSERLVRLVRAKYPFRPFVISYEELCELIGAEQCDTMDELHKAYPALKQLGFKVVMAVWHEMHNFFYRWPSIYYRLSANEFIRWGGGSRNTYYWKLASSKRVVQEMNEQRLPSNRVAENHELHKLVTARRKFDYIAARRFITRARQIGLDQAVQEYTK